MTAIGPEASLAENLAVLGEITVELFVRRRVPSLFWEAVRRPRAVELFDAIEALEPEPGDRLNATALSRICGLDLLVRGSAHDRSGEAFLAVEISRVVGVRDVELANDRARLLGRLGMPVQPAVAGSSITPEARRLAEKTGTLVRLLSYLDEVV